MEEISQKPLVIHDVEDEDTSFEFIAGGVNAYIGDFELEDQAKVSARERKKTYMMNKKLMYCISYYQWSYRNIKWVNIRLNRKNKKIESRLGSC